MLANYADKNNTKQKAITLFILAVTLFCLPCKALSYEVVEAETKAMPKKPSSAHEGEIRLNSSANYDVYTSVGDDFSPNNNKRKEFSIPNPLDEALIKRIKEANSADKAVKNTDNKKGITIDSKELEYLDNTGELEARGDVVITSGDNTVLTADKAIYDKNANVIKLFGNVVLKRDSNVVSGEYMAIDLNEENALMDAPVASVGTFVRVRAAEGYAYTDRIEAVNGSIDLAKKIEMRLQSSGFNSYDDMLIQDEQVSFDIKKQRLSPYKIKAKEIIVESKKDHDSLTLKNADLYYKKTKIAALNSVELFSDKEMNYVEANIPVDIGSIDDFGQYVGLGYIFKLPTGGNLKLAPALVYDDELGVGVLGTLKTKRLQLEGGWATSNENLIVDGRYSFTDKVWVDFARHAYKDEWFLGSKRPGHMIQLVYDDEYRVDDIRAVFRQRFTAGYVSDYLKKHQEDNNYGTMRLRWQSELSKHLFGVTNKEQDMALNFGVTGQTMATVYGTGETFALVRGGPYIDSRIKNWRSKISYRIGGTHGYSPFRFDEYTYGKSAIDIDESIKLCKYLSVGYRGTISPLKDNNKDDLLTENRFYAIVGPEDIKFAVSYDSIRSNTHFDLMFLLGTDKTNIDYKKLIIKDPDKLQKKQPSTLGRDWKYRRIKVPEDL